jgi:rfaE bifunctional protein nucleotidyltransferase chain/domain
MLLDLLPSSPKIISRAGLTTRIDTLREQGSSIICTNGVFDLMHIGHLRYLQSARLLGDYLIVGVNSDESTRSLKGPMRPLVSENERAEMLAGLDCVDFVTIFPEKTAEELVRIIRPHIYVKGGDYTLSPTDGNNIFQKKLPEADIVLSQGGRVELIPYLPNHSTTQLIDRILSLSNSA